MNSRRITLFALVVLIAAALYFIMALTASADEFPPYLPPDPVAVPNTPLPPTPTPEGTIPVYGCHHPSMQNPPAPQAVWGMVEGNRISLHWSSSGGFPLWFEARFFQTTHDENQSIIIRKESSPLVFVAPRNGLWFVRLKAIHACHLDGRILYVESEAGKNVDGEYPFFWLTNP